MALFKLIVPLPMASGNGTGLLRHSHAVDGRRRSRDRAKGKRPRRAAQRRTFPPPDDTRAPGAERPGVRRMRRATAIDRGRDLQLHGDAPLLFADRTLHDPASAASTQDAGHELYLSMDSDIYLRLMRWAPAGHLSSSPTQDVQHCIWCPVCAYVFRIAHSRPARRLAASTRLAPRPVGAREDSTFRQRSSNRGALIRVVHAANASVGPRHRARRRSERASS